MPVSVIGSASIAKPGIDAGADDGDLGFLGEGIDLLGERAVLADGIRQLFGRRDDRDLLFEHPFNLRHHLFQRRAGAEHRDVGLAALDRARHIVGDANLELAVEADHLAEIEADLGAIDVDRADNLKPSTRHDLARHGCADRTQPVHQDSNRHMESEDYIAARCICAGRDDSIALPRLRRGDTMNARDRQKTTPPTRPAGRGRSGGAFATVLHVPSFDFALSPPATGAALRTGPRQQRARQAPQVPPLAGPAPQAAVSPRTANYDIDVSLDPSTRIVTGSEVITWHNQGAIAAYSIRLHLYWNAFRNTNSTWLKQRRLAGDNPFAAADPDDFGYTDVTKITIVNRRRQRRPRPDQGSSLHLARRSEHGRSDRWPRRRWSTPSSPARRCGCASTGPAASRATSIARAPSATTSSSRSGSPSSVCSNMGWTAHQFFANSEFFADFGDYDVRMTVPRGWIVGATGVEQSGPTTPRRSGQTARRRIATRRPTSTTSPGRRVRTSSRSGSRSSMPGRAPVQMRLLIQPEHEHLADRHFAGAAAGSEVLRRVVRRLSVSGAHHRRSAVPERIGRHGVSDDLHGRHAMAVAADTATILNTSFCTKPATSSGTAWSPTTKSSSRGWMKGSTSTPTRACSGEAFQPNYLVQRFFGDFIPWQYPRHPRCSAPPTRTG